MDTIGKQPYLVYYRKSGTRKRRTVKAESSSCAMSSVMLEEGKIHIESVIGLTTFQMEYLDTFDEARLSA